jgi:hypothetical protein
MNRIATALYPPFLALAIMSCVLASGTFLIPSAIADTLPVSDPATTGPCYDTNCNCDSSTEICSDCACPGNANNCSGCAEQFISPEEPDECACQSKN